MRSKIGRQVLRLLKLEDSSERLAIAFAIGVFTTFSPLIGLHTVIALAIAFVFGLNRFAVLLGLIVNNPWTLIPYYTVSTYLGGRIVGFPQGTRFPDFRISKFFDANFWIQLGHQWRVLMPMAVGSTILALALSVLSYPLALYAIRRGRAAIGGRHFHVGTA